MDSASLQFVAFGIIVALMSNLSRSPIWRSTVLLAASIVFLLLLSTQPLMLIPLFGFLALGYAGLVLIQRGWSKSSVWSVLAVLFAYAWLKKYSLLPERAFIHAPYFTLGLSYILFRVLALLIEAGDTAGKLPIGGFAYLLYTLNFTTFVSGPIQRYDEFARNQFADEPLPLGPRLVSLQMERIVRGYFKVAVLAMLLQVAQRDALAQLSQPLPLTLRLFAAFRLIIAYPFFLYANFSGYIDIVIALARLMRVRLPENFDRPFSASSFLDFWNRWHITLSTWLKTYVYNPLLLGLMRRITSPALEPFLGVACFFITFFLVGVWHGRTSEFLVFGVLQGGGVAVNKLWQVELTRRLGRKTYKALAKDPFYIAFGRGLTFSWFAFTLFWFWGSWTQINVVFSAVSRADWLIVWSTVWLCATVTLTLWERMRSAFLTITASKAPILISRYARVVYSSAIALVSFVMTVLLNQPAPDIVYKAF